MAIAFSDRGASPAIARPAHARNSGTSAEIVFGFTHFKSVLALTKTYRLANGQLEKNGKQPTLYAGEAHHIECTSTEFAQRLEKLGQDEAISNGVMRLRVANVGITTKKRLAKEPWKIARAAAFFEYSQGPGMALLDIDLKTAPPNVKDKIESAGGVWQLICECVPALKAVLHITRTSTSAGLFDSTTGRQVQGSDGQHIYVLIKDMSDAARATNYLYGSLREAGYEWTIRSKSGASLKRTPLDRQVATAERLIFEGAPLLEWPLAQHPRPAVLVDGEMLDTRTAFPEQAPIAARPSGKPGLGLVISKPKAVRSDTAVGKPKNVKDRRKRRDTPRPESTQMEVKLWMQRLAFFEAVLAYRGGVCEGARNNWFFMMAVAHAWISSNQGDFLARLRGLYEAHFMGCWTWEEAQNSASAVTSLVEDLYWDLYGYKNLQIFDFLGISFAEQIAFKHLLRAATPRENEGVMGFPKLQGLDPESFRTAVSFRQGRGGAYAAAKRQVRPAHANKNVVRLRLWEGASVVDLAKEFSIPRRTLTRWKSELNFLRNLEDQAEETKALDAAATAEQEEKWRKIMARLDEKVAP